MRKTERKFEFSVVMAVYNVAPFLKEAVRSLARQTFGFGKIQLILVDDGSTDGSGALCDAFAAKYPRNVVVVHKENGGVSSARNAGLALAEGRYINFMDPDDKMSKNAFAEVHRFFQEHGGETDVVTIPLFFFDNKRGEHYLNKKFCQGSRVINLWENKDALLKFVNATFFKKESLNGLKFDERLSIGEDLKFCNSVLAEKMSLGLCVETYYGYRARKGGAQSALQSAKENPKRYLPCIRYLLEWIVEFCNRKFGYIPAYFQCLLLNELFWRINTQEKKPDCLSDADWKDYCIALRELFEIPDADSIISCPYLYSEYKNFLLHQKKGEQPKLVKNENEIALVFENKVFLKFSTQTTRVEFIKIEGDTLHIEGFLRFVGLSEEEPVGIEILSGKSSFPCTLIDRNTQSRLRFGIPLYRDVGFSADIPLEGWGTTIRIACAVRDTRVVRQRLTYGIFSSVGTEYRHGYFHAGHWAVQAHGGGLFDVFSPTDVF